VSAARELLLLQLLLRCQEQREGQSGSESRDGVMQIHFRTRLSKCH